MVANQPEVSFVAAQRRRIVMRSATPGNLDKFTPILETCKWQKKRRNSEEKGEEGVGGENGF